jgi:hypothetical protein
MPTWGDREQSDFQREKGLAFTLALTSLALSLNFLPDPFMRRRSSLFFLGVMMPLLCRLEIFLTVETETPNASAAPLMAPR